MNTTDDNCEPPAPPPADNTPTFADIKAILDHLVLGKEDRLTQRHRTEKFRWTTRDELLEAEVVRPTRTYRLIQPEFIGNGSATQTNLYRVLSPAGLDGFQMPFQGNINGEFATDEDLAKIAAWIDANCPA